jgi:drug/metabolite transporter (DMT)-like permease
MNRKRDRPEGLDRRMEAMVTTRPFPVVQVAPRISQATFRPSRHALAVAALIGANVVWGGSVVASKVALAHLPPLTLAGLRVAIALVVLELILRRTGARAARGRGPALLGLTGVALFCACQNLGLRVADAATTALIAGTIPVLTALLAVPLLGERLGGRRLGGLLVSLVGVAAVALLGPGASFGAATLGNLLPLASAAAFAAYAVLGRRIFGGGSALAVVAGSTRYGLLFLLPAILVESRMSEVRSITLQDGLLVLYLGVGCSALAFVCCGYGLAHLEAGQGAVFGNLKPLVGVALAVALLNEPVTVGQLGGGLLVLLGVGLAGGDSPSWGWGADRRASDRTFIHLTG